MGVSPIVLVCVEVSVELCELVALVVKVALAVLDCDMLKEELAEEVTELVAELVNVMLGVDEADTDAVLVPEVLIEVLPLTEALELPVVEPVVLSEDEADVDPVDV